jgi:hypothetical protein
MARGSTDVQQGVCNVVLEGRTVNLEQGVCNVVLQGRTVNQRAVNVRRVVAAGLMLLAAAVVCTAVVDGSTSTDKVRAVPPLAVRLVHLPGGVQSTRFG